MKPSNAVKIIIYLSLFICVKSYPNSRYYINYNIKGYNFGIEPQNIEELDQNQLSLLIEILKYKTLICNNKYNLKTITECHKLDPILKIGESNANDICVKKLAKQLFASNIIVNDYLSYSQNLCKNEYPYYLRSQLLGCKVGLLDNKNPVSLKSFIENHTEEYKSMNECYNKSLFNNNSIQQNYYNSYNNEKYALESLKSNIGLGFKSFVFSESRNLIKRQCFDDKISEEVIHKLDECLKILSFMKINETNYWFEVCREQRYISKANATAVDIMNSICKNLLPLSQNYQKKIIGQNYYQCLESQTYRGGDYYYNNWNQFTQFLKCSKDVLGVKSDAKNTEIIGEWYQNSYYFLYNYEIIETLFCVNISSFDLKTILEYEKCENSMDFSKIGDSNIIDFCQNRLFYNNETKLEIWNLTCTNYDIKSMFKRCINAKMPKIDNPKLFKEFFEKYGSSLMSQIECKTKALAIDESDLKAEYKYTLRSREYEYNSQYYSDFSLFPTFVD